MMRSKWSLLNIVHQTRAHIYVMHVYVVVQEAGIVDNLIVMPLL